MADLRIIFTFPEHVLWIVKVIKFDCRLINLVTYGISLFVSIMNQCGPSDGTQGVKSEGGG